MIFEINFGDLGRYSKEIEDFIYSIPKELIKVGHYFHINNRCGLDIVSVDNGIVSVQVVGM